jgi:hypothetical protein
LDLLSSVSDGSFQIVRAAYEKSHVDTVLDTDNFKVLMVPHHNSQELFEESLERACNIASMNGRREGEIRILVLHCNYDCDHITNDTALNLSKAKASYLLQSFDRIFIGHDHNAKTDFGGKLVVMGSINPTSFGDCHVDHCLYTLDSENELEKEVVWSAEEKYLEVDASSALLEGIADIHYDFIRITGKVSAEEVPELTKLVKSLWKRTPGPYAIRVDAQVVVNQGDVDTEVSRPVSFQQRVREILVSQPELLEVWDEVTSELEGDQK